jgi:hypothetical protein
MKKFALALLLAVAPLILSAASGTAIPGGIQNTPFIITKPGAYYLAANRVMTNTQIWGAIQINADNVTLDLNGFSVGFESWAPQGSSGHAIAVGGDNVEIRNGMVAIAPGHAIYSETDYLRLIDLRVLGTGGIKAEGDSSILERCHIAETHGTAIRLGGKGTARNCAIVEVEKHFGLGGDGIWLGSDTIAIGCTVDMTAGNGITCYGGAIVIESCRIGEANFSKESQHAGIVTYDGSATIRRCVLSRAHGSGIRIGALSVGTVLEDNVIKRSQAGGPAAGYAIVSLNGSTILQNNKGVDNAGGFIAGQYIDGGGNLGT